MGAKAHRTRNKATGSQDWTAATAGQRAKGVARKIRVHDYSSASASTSAMWRARTDAR
jgi:hypothetical protein